MRSAILSLSLGLLATLGTARAGEEEIAVKSLPKPVTKAVKAMFPEAKITKAIKEEKDHKVTYEVLLKDEGSKLSLAVTPKGKIVEVEKAIEAEKLPKAVRAALASKFPKAKIKAAEEVLKFEEEDGDDEAEEDEEEDDKPTKFYEVVLSVKGKGDVEVKLAPTWKVVEKEDEDDDEEHEHGKKKGKHEEGGKPGKKEHKD
jgi:hypothetical protein